MRLGVAPVLVSAAFLTVLGAAPADPPTQEVWTFDRIDRVGGHTTTILGHPRVIDTPFGKAVEFNGVDDGLFIDVHPLAGAATFTWEAIFRPDGGMPSSGGFIWKRIRQPGRTPATACSSRSA